MTDSRQELVERIRAALVAEAVAAFEDAGMRGLCCEGAWEVAVSALRRADLSSVRERASESVSEAPRPVR